VVLDLMKGMVVDVGVRVLYDKCCNSVIGWVICCKEYR
jgi:hypothetical protein